MRISRSTALLIVMSAFGLDSKAQSQSFIEGVATSFAHPTAVKCHQAVSKNAQNFTCPDKTDFARAKLAFPTIPMPDHGNIAETELTKFLLSGSCGEYLKLCALGAIYFPEADITLDRAGLPLEYKYLMVTQSALNPSFRSGIKAGLWGLNPLEAGLYGLRVDGWIDQRMIPSKSTEAAILHLSFLHDKFQGRTGQVILAFARGMVHMNQSGMDVAGADWSLKTDSQDRQFMATFFTIEKFFTKFSGPDFALAANHALSEFKHIIPDTTLQLIRVAEVLHLDPEQILSLNAHLTAGVFKPDIPGSFLTLDAEWVSLFQDSLHIIKKPKPKPLLTEPSVEPITHTVRRGESLGTIARKYKVGVAQLKRWNNLRGDKIYAGRKLTIGLPESDPVTQPIPNQIPDASSTEPGYSSYTVKAGDTLWAISQKFKNTTSEDIMMLNDIDEDIKPGQKLKIPKQ